MPVGRARQEEVILIEIHGVHAKSALLDLSQQLDTRRVPPANTAALITTKTLPQDVSFAREDITSTQLAGHVVQGLSGSLKDIWMIGLIRDTVFLTKRGGNIFVPSTTISHLSANRGVNVRGMRLHVTVIPTRTCLVSVKSTPTADASSAWRVNIQALLPHPVLTAALVRLMSIKIHQHLA
jgi:hypothetical protein